jgi:hypothetical protein
LFGLGRREIKMTKLENYLEDGANYRCKCCKEEIVEGLKKQREKAKDIMSKAELLHENLANCHPSIARGKVWCRTCGREKKVDPAESMRTGWPKCCGYTMTIDHPDTW